MQDVLLALLRGYRRWLSPRLGGGCRFVPSCSHYAMECVRRHGSVTGLRLTAWRLLRCREGCPSGHDPVPDRHEIGAALRGRLVGAAEIPNERARRRAPETMSAAAGANGSPPAREPCSPLVFGAERS